MALGDIFGQLGELEKMVIEVYSDGDYSQGHFIKKFHVLYNPASYYKDFKMELDTQTPVNAADRPLQFKYTSNKDMKIDLLLDATGASYSGTSELQQNLIDDAQRPSVEPVVQQFLDDCFTKNPEAHRPNYIKLIWGPMIFQGVLTAIKVNYSLFATNGNPLRAKLECTFTSHTSLRQQAEEAQQNSPDLTHYRIVEAAATLPLMTNKIYNSPDYYLEIARSNNLNNFRKLKQGSRLKFPPIEKTK